MKNILKLGLVVCGFALATYATTTEAKAYEAPSGGGCYNSGSCGVTSNGTILIGKWRE
jgi:hypothetical protein